MGIIKGLARRNTRQAPQRPFNAILSRFKPLPRGKYYQHAPKAKEQEQSTTPPFNAFQRALRPTVLCSRYARQTAAQTRLYAAR